MSESDSDVGGRLPSSYELSLSSDQAAGSSGSQTHPACPAALLSSQGSEQSVPTPLTSSSSDPPSVSPGRPTPLAIRSASPAPNTVRNADSSAAPDSVRSSDQADAALDRLLEAQSRTAPFDPARERSPHRRVALNYAIGTPSGSRATTPARRASPRAHPVTPRSPDDQVSELQGELLEMKRRLRVTEQYAQQHEQVVEYHAATAMTNARYEEEAMKQQFQEWGRGANEEISSLLNYFHASTLRGQQSEELVAHLQARLRNAENAAEEVHGQRLELHQAAAQIHVAEHKAASDAQLMEAYARQETLAAHQLKAEMQHVQTATDRLRGNLTHLESQAELREADREAVVVYRSALEREASMMRAEVAAKEQQLVGVKHALIMGQERNAAESRELAAMLQECRVPPAPVPPPPQAAMPPQTSALPGPPPLPSKSGEAPRNTGIEYRIEATQQKDATARSMTLEEHERLMKAAIGPLETKINLLQGLCEGATKETKGLMTRLVVSTRLLMPCRLRRATPSPLFPP